MPTINFTIEALQNLEIGEGSPDFYDTKEPGLIVRVNKDGSKTFYALYRRGQRKSIGTFGKMTIAEARQKTKDILAASNNGHLDQFLKKEEAGTNEPTYKEFLTNVYLSHLLTKRKTGRETYKMLIQAFSQTFGCKELPVITSLKLSKITFTIIERWTQEALLSGLAGSSINRYMVSFKASLSYAVRSGLITQNPAKDIERMPEEDPEGRYLIEQETPKFYSTLKQYAIDEFRVKVTLAVKGGPRPCEAVALTLPDIDLKPKRKGVSGVYFKAAYTKTNKKRFTPLNKLARVTLYLYLRKEFRPLGINIFKTLNRKDAPYQRRIFVHSTLSKSHRNIWKAFMKKAGITQFTPYDLRHDFISKIIMKTGDCYAAAKMTGTSMAMVQKHYGFLTNEHLASRVASLD